MEYPAERYGASPRPYQGLTELQYPFHDRTVTVTHCGRICIGRRKINLSHVFAGQQVGIREIAEKKMADLNANDVDAACRMLVGSARSMGLEVME